jgi:hypothetical protein
VSDERPVSDDVFQGIVDVLMREQGTTRPMDVFEEATSLYRVQFNTEVLAPDVEQD